MAAKTLDALVEALLDLSDPLAPKALADWPVEQGDEPAAGLRHLAEVVPVAINQRASNWLIHEGAHRKTRRRRFGLRTLVGGLPLASCTPR